MSISGELKSYATQGYVQAWESWEEKKRGHLPPKRQKRRKIHLLLAGSVLFISFISEKIDRHMYIFPSV
jgi:hypothetical protein